MTAKFESPLPGVSQGIDGLDVEALRQAIEEEYTQASPTHFSER
ncbi:MAG TPA: hypothetical protein VEK37_10055 [Gemmatimonadaceae bacterium]|nr:hypothetical protein [Gemmatimonadaceae bacterium]